MDAATGAAVVTRGLTKVFVVRSRGRAERRLAVDGLDLTVARGELFGLLGVNGAGKTTTIKLLSTLLEPSAGRAWVNGHDVVASPQRVRSSLGCLLPGERTLYWKLTAAENLEFYGTLYGMPPGRLRGRVREVLSLVGLEDRAGERVEKLSTGLRQRLGLARTILHDPPVLFLDEPTTGLDVHSARSLRALVRELAGRGRTVLLTTHNLQEAEALCDRVGIVHQGRLVALDSPEKLRRVSAGADILVLEVGVAGPGAARALVAGSAGAEAAANLRARIACVLEPRAPVSVEVEPLEGEGNGDRLRATVKGRAVAGHAADLVVELREAGYQVLRFEAQPPRLEDVFVELTGRPGGAAPC